MTGRALKVYGWTNWRNECPRAPNGGRQTREICAAPSKAAAERALGERIPQGFGGITGNDEEIAQAMSEPGVVFWRPLDHFGRGKPWTRVK
jgi:hypothetical protein